MKKAGSMFNKLFLNLKNLFHKQMYRAKKRKADIAIHMDLTKRSCLLLKDAYCKAKDCVSPNFACADINCSLCLRLKNAG